MQSQSQNIIKLLTKIEGGLTEIKLRSINTLYTKITVGIIEPSKLHNYMQMPGILMSWINENNKKSQHLYKVLSMISYFTKSQDGLLLLKQYESLQFFEELRKFLLSNQRNVQDYVQIIERIIKSLLPLGRSEASNSKEIPSQQEHQQLCDEQVGLQSTVSKFPISSLHHQYENAQSSSSPIQNEHPLTNHTKSAKTTNNTKSTSTNTKSTSTNNTSTNHSSSIELTFQIPKMTIPKKYDSKLYNLIIQLRHGKKELNFNCLFEISKILKYYGGQSFRYRQDLIKELTQCIETSHHKSIEMSHHKSIEVSHNSNHLEWLASYNLTIMLDQLTKKEEWLQKELSRIVNLQKNAITTQQVQNVTISLHQNIFHQTIFSSTSFDILVQYSLKKLMKTQTKEKLMKTQTKEKLMKTQTKEDPKITKIHKVLHWLLEVQFQYTPKYFIQILEYCINEDDMTFVKDLNKKSLIKSIEYYFGQFPSCRRMLFNLITKIQQKSSPKPIVLVQNFKCLMKYSLQAQQENAYKYISSYIEDEEDYDINSQLQNFNELVVNLEKGRTGISHHNKHKNLKVYMNVLLVVGIAVTRQDPLASHFNHVKQIILKISQMPTLRVSFYEELLFLCNNLHKIHYLNKIYTRSDIALIIVSHQQLFVPLFQESFKHQIALETFLQLIKKMLLNINKNGDQSWNAFQNMLSTFLSVFFCLTYHPKQQITSLAQFILTKIPKKYKIKIILMQLFSKNSNERQKISQQLLNENDILQQCYPKQLESDSFAIQSSRIKKKSLKINLQTINNYMGVLLNSKLDDDVRLSAGNQLLQWIGRIEEPTSDIIESFIFLYKDVISMLTHSKSYASTKQKVDQQKHSTHRQKLMQKAVKRQQLPQLLVSCLIRLYKMLSEQIDSYLPNNNPPLEYEVLLDLLLRTNIVEDKKCLLTIIYKQCFSSPFTNIKQPQSSRHLMHSSMMLYPHLQLIEMHLPTQISSNTTQQQTIEQQSNHLNTNTFIQHIKLNHNQSYKCYIEHVVYEYLNHDTLNSMQKNNNECMQKHHIFQAESDIFCSLLEKEIGSVLLHSNKSYDSLAFVNYSLQKLLQFKLVLPTNKLMQVSTILMNNLQVGKQPIQEELMMKIGVKIGLKRSKQVMALLNKQYSSRISKSRQQKSRQQSKDNDDSNTIDDYDICKYLLIQSLPIVDPPTIQVLIKKLVGLHNIFEIENIIMVLIKFHIKTQIIEMSEYCRLILVNTLVKYGCNPCEHEANMLRSICLIALIQICQPEQNKSSHQSNTNNHHHQSHTNNHHQSHKEQRNDKASPQFYSQIIYELLVEKVTLINSILAFLAESSNLYTIQQLCLYLELLQRVIWIQSTNKQKTINNGNKNISHHSLLKRVGSKLLLILQHAFANKLYYLTLTITNLLNTMILQNKMQQLDIADLCISMLSDLTEMSHFRHYYCYPLLKRSLKYEQISINQNNNQMQYKREYKIQQNRQQHLLTLLATSCMNHISIAIDGDQSFAQYILTSTTLLNQILNIFIEYPKKPNVNHTNQNTNMNLNQVTKMNLNQNSHLGIETSMVLIESMSKVMLKLAIVFEDVFIYKISQILAKNLPNTKQCTSNLFYILSCSMSLGHLQYMKLFSWLIVIYSKGRYLIDQISNIAINLAQMYLQKQIFLIKSLLTHSIKAKKAFLLSPFTAQYFKKIHIILENHTIQIIKQTHHKKLPKNISKNSMNSSNRNIHLIEENNDQNSKITQHNSKMAQHNKDYEMISNYLKLLACLFHSNSENLSEQQQILMQQTNEMIMKQALRKQLNLVQRMYRYVCEQRYDLDQLIELLMKVLKQISCSAIFSQCYSSYLCQVNSEMVDDALQQILSKTDENNVISITKQLKLSFTILNVLSSYESIRSLISKSRLIEQLNNRLICNQQRKQMNLHFVYEVVTLYISLSVHKDSSMKILNDKKILDTLLHLIYLQRSSVLDEKLIILLGNLSCYKHNKAMIINNREFHKIILGLIEDQDHHHTLHHKIILVKLLYNFLYKHSQAVKLYQKKQVVILIQALGQRYQQIQGVEVYASLMEVLLSHHKEQL